MIREGAVPAAGTTPISGAKNALTTNRIATTTAVKPVRPPEPIPAALSTKVVVLEVPKIAPKIVPIESAKRALSILELKPFPSSKAFSSSAEKIPVRRPVPINVPIVSNVSDRLKAKIVIKTSGRREVSVNNDNSPSLPNAAPNVTPSSSIADPNVLAARISGETCTTPIGIPTRVVAIIPIMMAPRTFLIIKIIVRITPNNANKEAGCVKLTSAGTIPPLVITVPIPPS